MVLAGIFLALLSHPVRPPYSFAVKVVGHGPPMILIPGLACGGDVWDSTVKHYEGRFSCHVLTLPGFAGQPPIAAPILPKVRDEIIAYIAENHLAQPVVIGHSLGGTMALWIAAASPASVGKVVAVDGVPYLPALMNPAANKSSIETDARKFRDSLAAQSQDAFATGDKQTLSYMITSPTDVDSVLKTSALSDPKSVGEAMYEMYVNDLRPLMSKVRTPVLLLAEGAFSNTPALQKQAMASYEAEVHLIPNHTVKMAVKARHFIMLDDPAFFFREVDAFLK